MVPKSCRIRGIGSTGRKCTGDHKDASLNLMPCRLNEGGAMAPRREGEAFCGHRNVFTVRLTFSNGRRSRRSDEHDRNPPSSLWVQGPDDGCLASVCRCPMWSYVLGPGWGGVLVGVSTWRPPLFIHTVQRGTPEMHPSSLSIASQSELFRSFIRTYQADGAARLWT